MTRVYVASRVARHPMWLRLRAELPDIQIASSWIDEAAAGETEDFHVEHPLVRRQDNLVRAFYS